MSFRLRSASSVSISEHARILQAQVTFQDATVHTIRWELPSPEDDAKKEDHR